jgi:hypothetical protein
MNLPFITVDSKGRWEIQGGIVKNSKFVAVNGGAAEKYASGCAEERCGYLGFHFSMVPFFAPKAS